jgi:hypothetical protein
MNRAKIFIAFTFLLAFAVCVSAQKSINRKAKITTKDKSEIMKQVFEDGFEKLIEDETFLPCTIPLVADKKIILIRTTESNIFPKEFGEFSFKFLSKEGIENEVKSNNGDCYFDTGNFQLINSQKVKLSLWRWIRVITVFKGESQYPADWVAAKGLVYEATKRKGKWQIKFLNGTGLVS